MPFPYYIYYFLLNNQPRRAVAATDILHRLLLGWLDDLLVRKVGFEPTKHRFLALGSTIPMLVLLVQQFRQHLGNLRILVLEANGIEDIISFSPGSLGIDIVAFDLVDVANDKEDVDIVGTLVGMVVLSDTNKILEVLSTPIHIAGTELNNSHGLEDRCNTIVVTAMHHSTDLKSFREAMHRFFILIHLAVDIAESQLSIGNSLVVQTKLTLSPLETILVTIEGGDVLLPILVDVTNIFHGVGGLESAAIPLADLESLVQ